MKTRKYHTRETGRLASGEAFTMELTVEAPNAKEAGPLANTVLFCLTQDKNYIEEHTYTKPYVRDWRYYLLWLLIVLVLGAISYAMYSFFVWEPEHYRRYYDMRRGV